MSRGEHQLSYDLLQRTAAYLTFDDVGKVFLAMHISNGAHFWQTRDDGVTLYFNHPLEVACLLAESEHDATTIIAALLHDVVEDTGYSLEQVRHNFGDEVAFIVDGVTKFTHKGKEKGCKTCTLNKVKAAAQLDKRVLVVKLADRIHNLQTLSGMKGLEKQVAKLHETRKDYLPLARAYHLTALADSLDSLLARETQRLERAGVYHDN